MATTYTGLLQLPKHSITDPFDITLINDMADLTDAAMAEAYQGRAVRNLIVNPFFAIAQPGYHALHGARYYAADCWIENVTYPTGGVTYNPSSGLTVTVPSVGRATIQHYIQNQDTNGIYTIAAKAGGVVYVAAGRPASGNLLAGDTTTFRAILSVSNTLLNVQLDCYKDITVEWAVCFPAAYTAKDLPLPIKNDYSIDLLTCQRYALYLTGGTVRYASTQVTSSIIDFTIPLPVAMRVIPSIANGTLRVLAGGAYQDGFTFEVTYMDNNAICIRASKSAHGLTSAVLDVSGLLLSSDI